MLTHIPRAGVLFFLLISTSSATAGEQRKPFNAEDYTKIVVDYMEGNYRNAAFALARVPTKELELAIEAYGEIVVHESYVKAALLLHTESVLWTHKNAPFHVRKARGWMRELDAYQRRPFEKKWFLVLGYYYARSLDPEAEPTLEAAMSVFPNEIEILLALGTWKEMAGWMRRDTDLLEEAEAIYRDVLRKVPETAEAIVRTGRVLGLLGQEDKALEHLTRGLEANREPAVRFAAFLTLGDIYRERGEPSKAQECYHAAVELDPKCQAAAVALSHALHESGDVDRSYEIVHEFFIRNSTTTEEGSSPEEERDLWWRYSLGHSHRMNRLLSELRKELEP